MADFLTELRRFFAELLNRRVFQVAGTYIAGAWAMTEILSFLFEQFLVPGWAYKLLAIIREDGRHAVLIIDDAQALATPETLSGDILAPPSGRLATPDETTVTHRIQISLPPSAVETYASRSPDGDQRAE